MQKISKLVAAVALCFAGVALTGCMAPKPQAEPTTYQQWFETVFDDEHGYIDFPGGGGIFGSTITSHDFEAGWYAVDLACKGTKDAAFTISRGDSTLGQGTVGCGDNGFITTTMDLPAGSIAATATSDDPEGMWHVRFRPTTAPTP